ncbi:hypothetical protein K435DRAFT_860504 [Dendrothele bispora CBS 962.96]|uniref:Uncharacterized protein n=1 Tax=Dendrothele bispora (strain CBS 962.96) TaxID=1314807 RepID=A0A4V4HFD8_DENBC|nr:hypothetical protein K435DRAFT_860504 [Dendrothele bispora CBS 962.96]
MLLTQWHRTAQDGRVWAWDCQEQEMVLLIPSVHALLGDNPMQIKGEAESDQGDDLQDDGDANSDITVQSNRAQGKKKSQESGQDMMLRIRQFMSCGEPRTRDDTLAELCSQFEAGSRIGGATSYKKRKTASGVKDVYQEYFINQIQAIASTKGISKPQKEAKITELRKTFPASPISPIWRIKGIDPHADTPVEILHVVLLGFVKYFWRDAVNCTKSDHDTLIARLSSAQVSGLNIPPLSGCTLVDYSGSLTGRDFRAIAQVAPFVLDGLLPSDRLEAWNALSSLVCLVWQPEILDVEKYLNDLELAIAYFLDCTCRVTPRWFNKPKFHVLLHLPEHVRRFGPAMLFATEGFESFNAVIRSCSIHSNRHAPSKDIAFRMARGNRIRHTLQGGYFLKSAVVEPSKHEESARTEQSHTLGAHLGHGDWVCASAKVQKLLLAHNFGMGLLGGVDGNLDMELGFERHESKAGELAGRICRKTKWSQTLVVSKNPSLQVIEEREVSLPESMFLANGDRCHWNSWVVWRGSLAEGMPLTTCIGQIVELVSFARKAVEGPLVDFATIRRSLVGGTHPVYHMPRPQSVEEYFIIKPKDIICIANVQHNCHDRKCPVTRTKTTILERERSTQKVLEVVHSNSEDVILNTVQMRSSAYIRPFSRRTPRENRESIIQNAVGMELQSRKKTNQTAVASSTP